MSQQMIKEAIQNKILICPECSGNIQSFEKYIDTIEKIWDGFGDSTIEMGGCKVTLVCGSCAWRERTEYWKNYLAD